MIRSNRNDTLTLNLTPTEKQQLLARIAETGPEADAFPANIVRQTLAAPVADDENDMPAPGEFLYDVWKDRLGRIDGPSEALSEQTGDEFEMPAPGESAYDAMKDQVGGFHTGGDGTFSQNTGKAFTEYVVEKHRQGKL